MERRKFAKTSLKIAMGSVLFPNINFGAKEEELIIGHGEYKYIHKKNWGVKNISKYPVKDCHEMVQDSKKRLIFCTNETKNNIIILDKSGKFVKSWGNTFPGAHGLSIFNENGEDFLFLTDTTLGQVLKFTIDGRELLKLEYPFESQIYNDKEKVKYSPTETAIAPNGDIYVADGYGSSYILVYDKNGKFKNIFGGFTGNPDGLVQAHGVCIDSRDKDNPKVICTSRTENKYKVYTLEGKHLATYSFPGSYVCRAVIKGDMLFAPVIISRPDPLIGDDWNSKSGFFLVLDKNFKIISAPGSDNFEYDGNHPKRMTQSKSVRGIIKHVHDICVDDEENVYIPQWNSDKGYPLKWERV